MQIRGILNLGGRAAAQLNPIIITIEYVSKGHYNTY